MATGLRVVLCCIVVAVAAGTPNSTPSASYDTIVVGLGSAGVTAAAALAKADRRVLGLEAQGRIGGRVHTVPFGDGVIELGAEWIHGTENSRTYELATQYNISILPTVTTPMGIRMLRSDGTEPDTELVNDLLRFCVNVVGEHAPNPPEAKGKFVTRKLTEYIEEHKPDVLKDHDFMIQFLEFANHYVKCYDAANDWNDVSTDSKYEELGGRLGMSWHRHGYKTFFDLMLNTYKDGPGLSNLDIKLNKEVSHIAAPQSPTDKVVVKCKDGSSYEADTVIVTVSLGVLKAKYSSLFSPPLPKDKQTAIDKLSIGVLDKIVLSFDEPWWPQTNNSMLGFLWKREDRRMVPEADKWTTIIAAVTSPIGASNVLMMWIAGDAAKEVETLPEHVLTTKCLEFLQRFIGDYRNITVPKPTAMKRSAWYTNPYTRGSYSFDNLETPQYPLARAWLGSPVVDSAGAPRVLFAGEATNLNHYKTVHGASETGYREAMRLLSVASKI